MKQQKDVINSEIEHQKKGKKRKLITSSTSKDLNDVGQGPHPQYKIKQDRPQPDILQASQHLSWSHCPHSLHSLPSHSPAPHIHTLPCDLAGSG